MKSLHSWVETLRAHAVSPPQAVVFMVHLDEMFHQGYAVARLSHCCTFFNVRDFYSTVLVNAVRVKSYVHAIFPSALETILIKIKKILRFSRANRISCSVYSSETGGPV